MARSGFRRPGSALLAVAAVLAACAPLGETRREAMARFVGRPEGELILALGVPFRSYESAGIKYLAFEESRIDLVPSPLAPTARPYAGPRYDPPVAVQRQCETTAAVSNGVVAGFSFRGNAC
jgi:hypothetical protein